ncbi:MAG: hypothetical protein J5I53_05980, partial [Bradyrhizobiaceae bacterium]|nr:hypothetical protein [Bradyrhizobiaceae bacterium]
MSYSIKDKPETDRLSTDYRACTDRLLTKYRPLLGQASANNRNQPTTTRQGSDRAYELYSSVSRHGRTRNIPEHAVEAGQQAYICGLPLR